MYGAILGDIISLRHKRDESGRCYLVEPKVKFTDYTVSMIALADALTSVDSDDMNQLEEKIRQSLTRWGKEYPYVNYGALARASIIPYIYNDRARIEEVAQLSTVITHSDFDNFVNSQFATLAVFYGMRSSGKNGARNNFESEIGFEMSALIDQKNIVAEAMEAFLNSTDVRSAIENAIARGGDISVRAIIAGSIAEGFTACRIRKKKCAIVYCPKACLRFWTDSINFREEIF